MRNFQELRDKMSLERRERVEKRTKELLKEIEEKEKILNSLIEKRNKMNCRLSFYWRLMISLFINLTLTFTVFKDTPLLIFIPIMLLLSFIIPSLLYRIKINPNKRIVHFRKKDSHCWTINFNTDKIEIIPCVMIKNSLVSIKENVVVPILQRIYYGHYPNEASVTVPIFPTYHTEEFTKSYKLSKHRQLNIWTYIMCVVGMNKIDYGQNVYSPSSETDYKTRKLKRVKLIFWEIVKV